MSWNNEKDLVFGYGYDFWIYCVGQKEIKIDSIGSKKLLCKATYYSGVDSFAFPVCDSFGVFCNFTSLADECGGTVFIRENDDQSDIHFKVPWRNKEEAKGIKRIVVCNDYKDEIVKVIYDVLDQSPVRKIYLHVRCQCPKQNNIIGMLTGVQIEELIRENKLLSNVVYAIYDPQ